MKVTVKREDRIQGYESVLIDVIVQTFDEDGDFEDEFIKQIKNKDNAEFNFELPDSYEYAVKCHIDDYDIREWFGLKCGQGHTELKFGLKKAHIEIVEDFIAEQLEKTATEPNNSGPKKTEAATLHPSQIVDTSFDTMALASGIIAVAAGVAAFFVPAPIRPLFIFIALVSVGILFFAASNMEQSGSRCTKCNSNMIKVINSKREIDSVYSRQERVLDKNTGNMTFDRVTCTDTKITMKMSCDLCGAQWTQYSFKTKVGD